MDLWRSISLFLIMVMVETDGVVQPDDEATKDEYPFMAMVLLRDFDEFICGGTLVNMRTVITAKHCVDMFNAEAIGVRLGEYDREKSEGTEQDLQVQEIISHNHSDVSILILSTSPTLSPSVQPISGLTTRLPTNGYPMTVVGWGWMHHAGETEIPAMKLQELRLPMRPSSHCREDDLNITRYDICAGYSNGKYVNVCHGDSGGPLVTRASPESPWQLIGVVSRGHDDCSHLKHHAMYGSIPALASWLEEKGVTAMSSDTRMETTTEPAFIRRFRDSHTRFTG